MKTLKLHDSEVEKISGAIRLLLDAAMETAARSEDADFEDQTVICMAFVLAPWLVLHELMEGEVSREEASDINQIASQVAQGLRDWMGKQWQDIVAPRH